MENCQQVIDLVACYRIQWTRHTRQRKKKNNNGRIPKKRWWGRQWRRISRCANNANVLEFLSTVCKWHILVDANLVVTVSCRSFCTLRMRDEQNTIELAQHTRLMLLWFLFRISSIVQIQFQYLPITWILSIACTCMCVCHVCECVCVRRFWLIRYKVHAEHSYLQKNGNGQVHWTWWDCYFRCRC